MGSFVIHSLFIDLLHKLGFDLLIRNSGDGIWSTRSEWLHNFVLVRIHCFLSSQLYSIASLSSHSPFHVCLMLVVRFSPSDSSGGTGPLEAVDRAVRGLGLPAVLSVLLEGQPR